MSRRIFTTPSSSQAPATEQAEVLSDLPELDIDRLLSHSGEILRREVANLLGESSKGKLNSGSSRDLVSYINLLHELKERELARLHDMSDEELARLASKS